MELSIWSVRKMRVAMGGEDERRESLLARIEQFHGVSLEQILGEIEYLRDAGDLVIAGGSLAYGLGNHLSDLDLVVGGPTTVDSSGIPLQHFIGSLRVEVWKLAQGLIEKTVDRAEEALASKEPLLGSFGNVDHEDELKLLHRIVFGIVIDGVGLELTQGRDYRAVASGLVIREYAERMRTSALLAQLALQASRPIAAVVNARLAVEEALNAAIVQRGLPFTGDKWLRERLTNQTTDLAPAYEPFRQLPEDPAQDARRFVDAALAACIGMWGLDLEVDTLLPAASWRNSDLQCLEVVGADRLLVSVGSGALWSLDDGEAESWRQLVSAGSEDPGAVWDLGACDMKALTLCLRLHEQGVLGLHWANGVALEDLEATRSVEA
jgi:hypothetical protein